MEPIELVELLAGGRELDRRTGDGLHAQRRAAARVAVELRQHDAVERDVLLERLRDVDRFLARHRVEDEQHVVRLRLVAYARQLFHQCLVDVEAAGGVEDHDVAAVFTRARDSVAHGLHRIAAVLGVDRYVDLLAELR